MKAPYSNEVANHAGPEHCVLCREVQGEALTGARIGQPNGCGRLCCSDFPENTQAQIFRSKLRAGGIFCDALLFFVSLLALLQVPLALSLFLQQPRGAGFALKMWLRVAWLVKVMD